MLCSTILEPCIFLNLQRFKIYSLLKTCWYFVGILTACNIFYYYHYYFVNIIIIDIIVIIIIIIIAIIIIVLLYLAYLLATLSQ